MRIRYFAGMFVLCKSEWRSLSSSDCDKGASPVPHKGLVITGRERGGGGGGVATKQEGGM